MSTEFKKRMDKLGELIELKLVNEFINQGHNLTGKTANSIEAIVSSTGNSIEVQMLESGIIMNKGVKASNIPYGGKGKGGKSKFIEALTKYARLRGMKDPRKAAFAMANKMKSEGMPTKGSRRFSKTGKRTGFVDEVFKKNDKLISQRISQAWSKEMDARIDDMIKVNVRGV